MKFIEHYDPPYELANRSKHPVERPTKAWEAFAFKDKVRESLRYCQNNLCGYCEIEVDERSRLGAHLEHIRNKEFHPNLTFDYRNIILSCFSTGGEVNALGEDLTAVSCGHSVGKRTQHNEELFISPTELNCQSFFSYELTGEIVPAYSLSESSIEYRRAKYTIDLLNLNCARLVRQRLEVLEEGYKIIDAFDYGQGNSNREGLRHFLSLELKPASTGYRQYFAFISLRQQFWSSLYQQL